MITESIHPRNPSLGSYPYTCVGRAAYDGLIEVSECARVETRRMDRTKPSADGAAWLLPIKSYARLPNVLRSLFVEAVPVAFCFVDRWLPSILKPGHEYRTEHPGARNWSCSVLPHAPLSSLFGTCDLLVTQTDSNAVNPSVFSMQVCPPLTTMFSIRSLVSTTLLPIQVSHHAPLGITAKCSHCRSATFKHILGGS